MAKDVLEDSTSVINHSFIHVYSSGEINKYTISIAVSYTKTIYTRRRITTPKIDAVNRGTKITKQNVFYIIGAFGKPSTKHILAVQYITLNCFYIKMQLSP